MTMVLSVLVMMLFLLAFGGTARHFSLPAAKRAELKKLHHDHEELLSWVVACDSNLLTTLDSNTWAISHYNEKIAGLKEKADGVSKQIAAIEATRWGKKPDRAPAPQLNPKWDVTKCPHAIIEPVIPSGETELVAWICLSPECYDQLEVTDPAVARHLEAEARVAQQKQLAANWDKIKDWTEEDSARARKALSNLQAHQDRVALVKGEQTEEQAKRFAARTRENEDMARKGRFSKGGYNAGSIYLQTVPSMDNFAKNMPRKANWEKKRQMDKKKGRGGVWG